MQRRQLSREDLIRELQEREAAAGRRLTMTVFCGELRCSHRLVYRHFQTWGALRKAAGLPPPRSREYSTQEIRDAFRRVVDEEGPDVSFMMFAYKTGITHTAVARHFGSWKGLRAELDLPARTFPNYYSDEELLEDLDRLARQLGRYPRKADINRYGKFCAQTYTRRFGWKVQVMQALRKYRVVQACIRRFGPESVQQPVDYKPDLPPKPFPGAGTFPLPADVIPEDFDEPLLPPELRDLTLDDVSVLFRPEPVPESDAGQAAA